MNILYYSNFCDKCLYLFQKLQNENLFFIFDKIICVDKLDNIPENITCVPCIITNDYNIPLINEFVFKWIDFKNVQITEKIKLQENNCSSGTCNINNTQSNAGPPPRFPPRQPFGSYFENASDKKKQVNNSFEDLQNMRSQDDLMFGYKN